MSLKINDITSLHSIYCLTATVSICLNILMIYIIAYKSPKNMGAYKHLLILIALSEIFYSITDAILTPIHLSHKSAIIVISGANYDFLGREFYHHLKTFFWALFGASLAFFAVNFVYRYLVISMHSLLESFNSWKFAIWMLIPLSNAVIWSITSEFLCCPDKEMSDFVREEVFSEFGKNIDQLVYRGVFLYETDANGELSLRYKSFFPFVIMSTCVSGSFGIISYFGVKCYNRITTVLEVSSSSHHQILQKQLFYALVLQTLIPVLFMNLPITVMFVCGFLNIDLGAYSALATVFITTYPAVDPLPNFIIIKPYRDAVLDILKCRKGKVEPLQLSLVQMIRFSA